MQPHRLPRRRTLAVAFVLVASVAAVGCLPPPPPPPPPLSPMTIGVTHVVGFRQTTVVDSTRATSPLGGYPGSPTRAIPLSIWYPSDGGGPFPLVVFAHGFAVTPSFYASLLPKLAAAGYVVVAPTYPMLSGQPAGPTEDVDWGQLFPDTRFVISQMLTLSASSDPTLGGMIDPQRIAVAGHSDGAEVAFGVGYQPLRLDPRVRAVVAMAAEFDGLGGYQPNGRPILHVLSDDDEFNSYGNAIAWDRAHLQDPKSILSLWNAGHAAPFTDTGDPHFALVVRVTIAFLDSTLKAHPEAMTAAAHAVAAQPSLASLE